MLKLGQGFARRQEPEFVAGASEAVTEMLDFFSAQIDERTAQPRDDLLSVLAASIPEDENGRPDVLANCIFFIEAGHATTTSLISAGTLLLLEHPRDLERLRDQPDLIPLAVEEMLRLVTPVTLAICCPREDVSLAGYRFHADVPRFAFLAAANRDPAVFPEPDRFDIDRASGHLAFSSRRALLPRRAARSTPRRDRADDAPREAARAPSGRGSGLARVRAAARARAPACCLGRRLSGCPRCDH